MTTTIKKFTIFGERCSGTNFLEETILNNFNINITWDCGWKHFFGFYDFSKNNNHDDTLFIGIIREPISWMYSFYKTPHHIPEENRSMPEFLLNEFYSIGNDNNLITSDLNYITKQKYKNIFEMRYFKNEYLMNSISKKVKNYILIRYEDLLLDNNSIINKIKNTFNLNLKNENIIKIDYCYKNKNNKFIPKQIKFSQDILNIIKNNLNIEQENKLNYII
jgi:hypothetical protein